MKTYNYLPGFLFLLLYVSIHAQTHIWTGDGGNEDWFNAANWSANTVPDANSDVVIDQSNLVIIEDHATAVNKLELIGEATLTLAADLTIGDTFRIQAGANLFWNEGGLIGGNLIENNGTISLATTVEKHLTNTHLVNNANFVLIYAGILRLIDSPIIDNTSTGFFQILGGGSLTHQTGNPVFNNAGFVIKLGNVIADSSYMIMEMNNEGIIDVGDNQAFLFLSALGELNNLENGILTGTGAYDITSPFQTPGTISPGDGLVGTLEFVNNFSLSPQTKLRLDIAGTNSGEYDVIAVTGFPDLDGELLINLAYTPQIGDEFTIITANDITSCNFPAQVTNTLGGGPVYLFDVECNATSVVLRVVDEVLDTPDFASEELRFFVTPNPVTESFEVILNASEAITNSLESLSLRIYNMLGQEVKHLSNFSEESNTFQKGNLSEGVYVLQLSSEKKVIVTTKMVVQ